MNTEKDVIKKKRIRVYTEEQKARIKIYLAKRPKILLTEEQKLRQKEIQKIYYLNNKEKFSINAKKNRKNNREKIKEAKKIYYNKNKEKISERDKKHRKEHKDIGKKKYAKNKDKLLNDAKIYSKNNRDKINEYRRKYKKQKRLTDSLFKLKHNISCLIRMTISRKGYKKKCKTSEILGCSYEEFKLYLEAKFLPWMNWDNYGLYNGTLNYGWDIDHRIPICTATNEEDVIRLNHYTNLQPLCSKVNRDIKNKDLVL